MPLALWGHHHGRVTTRRALLGTLVRQFLCFISLGCLVFASDGQLRAGALTAATIQAVALARYFSGDRLQPISDAPEVLQSARR